MSSGKRQKGKWDSSDEEDTDNNSNSVNGYSYGQDSAKRFKSSNTEIVSLSQQNNDREEQSVSITVVESVTNSNEAVVDSVAIVSTSATSIKTHDFNHNGSTTISTVEETVTSKHTAKDSSNGTKKVHNSLLHGCRSVECYQRLNFIDQGTYGMVFRAKCLETNEVYALKQVKLGPETNKIGFPVTALREINILMALQHPNIVRVREMVVGSSIDKIYMVMEYCENDLKKCMSKQPFSTAEVKQLMIQLLSGVEHMHSNWYIHRDLKTSNLLYSNTGILSICDFGLARKFGE